MKKIDRVILSGATKLRSRRISTYLFVSVLIAFLAACDDSSSASAGSNDEPGVESSSSVELGSSSSEKVKSQSSSSEKSGMSSSSVNNASSSSEKLGSSSSVETPKSSSSSSADEMESSSNSKIGCKTETEDDCEYGELTDDRDDKKYKTVKIGDQWWMAENLNYADSVKTPSLLKRNWCYKNEPDSCSKYGRLYTWAAAIDSVTLATDADNPQDCGYGETCTLPARVQGICPEGWHLPTQSEWDTLFTAVGGQSNAGKVLKSQAGWNNDDYGDSGNGTDSFGFSALPAGNRYDGNFRYRGYGADFWSATQDNKSLDDEYDAYGMNLYNDRGYAFLSDYGKDYAFSVRCVKD